MMPGTMSPPPRPPGAKWPGFLINRSGLPFDELTWNELWEFAAHLRPEARQAMREIQSAPVLEEVSVPTPPHGLGRLQRGGGSARHRRPSGNNNSSANVAANPLLEEEQYLGRVQDYLCRLTYNHTGTQFFETRPGSSLLTLMETARAMTREALPVKCMEAVVLAISLTNGVPGLGRFTINFKSELPPQQQQQQQSDRRGKRYFYHVVLGVSLGSRFGALGLSRRASLMDKPLSHASLSSLVDDFDRSYRQCGHRLVKVRVGRLVSHDPYSISPIPWRGVTVHPRTDDADQAQAALDRHARELKSYLRINSSK